MKLYSYSFSLSNKSNVKLEMPGDSCFFFFILLLFPPPTTHPTRKKKNRRRRGE
jgi:hypothetical protein